MGWTHIEDKIVKARTRHRCYLCGETINWGEHYLRRVGVDSGYGKMTTTMHPECEAETRDWDEMDWECFMPGEFERPRERVSDREMRALEAIIVAAMRGISPEEIERAMDKQRDG